MATAQMEISLRLTNAGMEEVEAEKWAKKGAGIRANAVPPLVAMILAPAPKSTSRLVDQRKRKEKRITRFIKINSPVKREEVIKSFAGRGGGIGTNQYGIHGTAKVKPTSPTTATVPAPFTDRNYMFGGVPPKAMPSGPLIITNGTSKMTVTPGVIDAAAITLFTQGGCTALAAKIAQATGGEVVGTSESWHTGVLVNGKVIDITGAHDPNNWMGEEARRLPPSYIRDEVYYQGDTFDGIWPMADSMVGPVLKQAAAGTNALHTLTPAEAKEMIAFERGGWVRTTLPMKEKISKAAPQKYYGDGTGGPGSNQHAKKGVTKNPQQYNTAHAKARARMLSEQDWEDLTQEAYAKIARTYPDKYVDDQGQFDPSKVPGGLVNVTVDRLAIDQKRKEERRGGSRNESFDQAQEAGYLDLLEDAISSRGLSRREYAEQEEKDPVKEALKQQLKDIKMPEDQKRAVFLVDYVGLKPGKAAEITGQSPESMRVDLHRGRKKVAIEQANSSEFIDPYEHIIPKEAEELKPKKGPHNEPTLTSYGAKVSKPPTDLFTGATSDQALFASPGHNALFAYDPPAVEAKEPALFDSAGPLFAASTEPKAEEKPKEIPLFAKTPLFANTPLFEDEEISLHRHRDMEARAEAAYRARLAEEQEKEASYIWEDRSGKTKEQKQAEFSEQWRAEHVKPAPTYTEYGTLPEPKEHVQGAVSLQDGRIERHPKSYFVDEAGRQKRAEMAARVHAAPKRLTAEELAIKERATTAKVPVSPLSEGTWHPTDTAPSGEGLVSHNYLNPGATLLRLDLDHSGSDSDRWNAYEPELWEKAEWEPESTSTDAAAEWLRSQGVDPEEFGKSRHANWEATKPKGTYQTHVKRSDSGKFRRHVLKEATTNSRGIPQCVKCKVYNSRWIADHKRSVREGGSMDAKRNGQVLCYDCSKEKSSAEQVRGYKRYRKAQNGKRNGW